MSNILLYFFCEKQFWTVFNIKTYYWSNLMFWIFIVILVFYLVERNRVVSFFLIKIRNTVFFVGKNLYFCLPKITAFDFTAFHLQLTLSLVITVNLVKIKIILFYFSCKNRFYFEELQIFFLIITFILKRANCIRRSAEILVFFIKNYRNLKCSFCIEIVFVKNLGQNFDVLTVCNSSIKICFVFTYIV